MQSLKFLSLINIQLPSIVTLLTQNLDISKRNIFAFFIDANEEQYGCDLPSKVRLIKLSCIGLNNTSIEITVILLLLLLKLIISIPALIVGRKKRTEKNIDKGVSQVEGEADSSQERNKVDIFKKKQGLFSKIIEKLDQLLTLSLIIPLANAFTLKLLIGHWVSFYSLHRITTYSALSMSIMVLILLYNAGFLFLALYFVHYHHKMSKVKDDFKELSKTNTLISIFDVLCSLSRTRNVVYSIFITIQDLILSLVFVLGQIAPFLQISVALLLYLTEICLLFSLTPLKSLKENILGIINTTSHFIIVSIFLCIFVYDSKVTAKEKSLYFGIPILGVMIASIVINFAIEFLFAIIRLVKKVSGCFGIKKIKLAARSLVSYRKRRRFKKITMWEMTHSSI